jgi:hypothetical protein
MNDRARDLQDLDAQAAVQAGVQPGVQLLPEVETPALLLPDGSRSALCRGRAGNGENADPDAVPLPPPARSQRSVLTGAAAD